MAAAGRSRYTTSPHRCSSALSLSGDGGHNCEILDFSDMTGDTNSGDPNGLLLFPVPAGPWALDVPGVWVFKRGGWGGAASRLVGGGFSQLTFPSDILNSCWVCSLLSTTSRPGIGLSKLVEGGLFRNGVTVFFRSGTSSYVLVWSNCTEWLCTPLLRCSSGSVTELGIRNGVALQD